MKTTGFFNFLKGELKYENLGKFEIKENSIQKYSYHYPDYLIDYFLLKILSDKEKVNLKKMELSEEKCIFRSKKNL